MFFFDYNTSFQISEIIEAIMTSKNVNATSDMMFKIIIVGDSGVGKTNLLTYFCEGVFK